MWQRFCEGCRLREGAETKKPLTHPINGALCSWQQTEIRHQLKDDTVAYASKSTEHKGRRKGAAKPWANSRAAHAKKVGDCCRHCMRHLVRLEQYPVSPVAPTWCYPCLCHSFADPELLCIDDRPVSVALTRGLD